MTELQKERSGNSKLSFLDILILLFLFASPIINSLLFIFGGASASGQLAKVYIVVAIGTVLYLIGKVRSYISRAVVITTLVFGVLGASFLLTGMRIGTNNVYFSELKAYIAMIVCVLLLTLSVFWTEKTEINTKIVFALDVVVSAVSFIALFRETGGGLIHDASGLLYQNIAYYAAFCFGMNIFLLKELQLKSVRPSAWQQVGLVAMSLMQIFTSFLSGGRGGTILVLVLLLYGLVTLYGVKQIHKGIAVVIVAVVLMLVFVPQLLDWLEFSSKGLARTLGIFTDNFGDANRTRMYRKALGYFWQHPVFGNGIGSVLVLMGIYSHNAATDILCETGVIGMICVLIVLGRYCRRTVTEFHNGSLYRFLTMIFICGFTMNLFSGYIWVNQNVWLPVVIALSCGQGNGAAS